MMVLLKVLCIAVCFVVVNGQDETKPEVSTPVPVTVAPIDVTTPTTPEVVTTGPTVVVDKPSTVVEKPPQIVYTYATSTGETLTIAGPDKDGKYIYVKTDGKGNVWKGYWIGDLPKMPDVSRVAWTTTWSTNPWVRYTYWPMENLSASINTAVNNYLNSFKFFI